MKAICWYDKNDVQVEHVPDPTLLNPRDAVIKITCTAICGSDLHLYNGLIPTMKAGDILGHEFMGEVVEVGHDVKNLQCRRPCGRPISYRLRRMFLLYQMNCSRYVRTPIRMPGWPRKCGGIRLPGIFGYSHMLGGYAGGQAEYARVPFADVGPIKIPDGLSDEQVLFLSDIFPTGYMAAENCDIKPGDTIAVWGCGPVGQFAIKSAFMLGAERVIAIDRFPERLRMARERAGAETTINYEEEDVYDTLMSLTGGRGPDACIDAVGMEAHAPGVFGAYDRVKQAVMLETDRPTVLRQAIMACRSGGTVSIPGVYGGFIDKVPFGSIMNRALTIKTGQTHVQRYMRPLLERIERGEIDPSFVITHRLRLDEAPRGYETFLHKQDECIKVVLKP